MPEASCLANSNQRNNTDSSKCTDELCKCFIANEVTNNRKCKVRINYLTICCDESSKESTETHHDKPVGNTCTGEVEHLCMSKDFLEHILHTRTTVVATCGIWLLRLIESNQLPHSNCKESERNDGNEIRERDQYEHER